MSKKEHYVNNKEFFEALVLYKKSIIDAEKQGLSKPKITNYIGHCFLKIATHLSYKPNFVNYIFKDDMICDGIENCLRSIDNFDPEKSTNPFAYFTQITYYAFLRRIKKEKKQLEIKIKLLEKSSFEQVFSVDSSAIGYDTFSMNSIKQQIKSKSRNYKSNK